MPNQPGCPVLTMVLVALVGIFSSPRTAVSQVTDTSAVAETTPWTPSTSYLFSAPTGRTLGAGELLVGVRAVHLRGDRQILGPLALLDFGLTDRIALTSGYWFQSYGQDQDGAAVVGASANIGSADAPLAVQVQANLPINHYLGRRLSELAVMGVRQWGDASRALTVGGGWSGARSLCRPEWEGCQEEWHGNVFGLLGGYLSVSDHVQLVSENYLGRSGSLETLTGIRAGYEGLTIGVALGCEAYAGMGFGADCDQGVQLSASYQFRLIRER
jgi:hypothetical protein